MDVRDASVCEDHGNLSQGPLSCFSSIILKKEKSSFINKMDAQKNSNNDEKRVQRSKLQQNQEINNPCYKEHLLSLKCLEANQNDRDACGLYFQNYKNCNRFWAFVEKDRKLKGIKPHLPPPEERKKIKMDYLESKKL